jgi:hypothetical protein
LTPILAVKCKKFEWNPQSYPAGDVDAEYASAGG